MTNPIESYREELIRQDKSAATVRNYVNDVELFVRWRDETYVDNFEPSKVVQREVIEYRGYLTGTRSASPATVNRRLASISSFFRWCVVTKRAASNPADGVKGIDIVDPGPRALDNAALRRLLREVHVHGNARDIAILELLCGTGLRVGELVALTVDDVDIGERKGTAKVRNGKGRRSRELPLNVDVRKVLAAYVIVRPITTGRSLFTGQRGGSLTSSGVWRIVKKYAAMAGVPELRVHDLRHTVLTRLVRELGCDLATVAKISGHRNLKTLMRYAEPTPDDLANAVEKLAFTG